MAKRRKTKSAARRGKRTRGKAPKNRGPSRRRPSDPRRQYGPPPEPTETPAADPPATMEPAPPEAPLTN